MLPIYHTPTSVSSISRRLQSSLHSLCSLIGAHEHPRLTGQRTSRVFDMYSIGSKQNNRGLLSLYICIDTHVYITSVYLSNCLCIALPFYLCITLLLREGGFKFSARGSTPSCCKGLGTGVRAECVWHVRYTSNSTIQQLTHVQTTKFFRKSTLHQDPRTWPA